MEHSFRLACFCLAVTLFVLKPPWLVSADNMYVLKTPGDNQHSKMWLTTESSFIRFKFQGCSDLKVALARDPQVTSTNTYEIIVGGWTNSQSAIRRALNGANLVTVLTPGVLSCDEARPFWIGWQNGNITVGKGSVTGQESFMNYVDPEPYLVVAVSLASGYGGSGNGTYYVYQDETRIAIATTPPVNAYTTLWLLQSQKSYVKFGVKACNDALLALSAQMDSSTLTYEVVIGGYNNTQSDIRPGYSQTPPSISASTPGILSCNETRYFWVSYEGGLIEVGRGLELGQRRFLHWKYENPHAVTAIGFSGWDVEDEWEFSHTEDGAMLLRTQSDNPVESNWIDVSGKTLFMFRLKACSFGKIELRSSHENWTSTPAYEIIFGGMDKLRGRRDRPDLTTTGFDNIEIIYLEANGTRVSKIFQVNDLLSCDIFRRFWLSWRNQKIEIGRDNPYNNIVATVDDPVFNRGLKTLHLGTGDLLHQQEWEFVMTSVLATAVKTSSASGDSFKSNWVTVRDKQSFVFRVRGCYDARIILASYTKVVDVSSYEIMIGANGNQVSRIGKDGLAGGNVVEASTPNVLHCTETRYFWVSWGGGYIQVGSGRVPGESGFLQLQDSAPYKVRSLAFDADSPTVAVWEFGTEEGQSYVVQTPADEFAGRRYFRLSTHKQSFAFEVVACKDAIVSLSNGSHTVAEVIIGAEENTKTIIRSLEVEQPTQVENSTIGILNCDSRRGFWIQFVYDFVRFGQGDLNEGLILELHIKFLTVEALSISTKGVRGIWTLNQQSGKFVETETPNVYAYNFTWMTVDDRKAMVFNVKACSDAHIALSSQLGITYIHTYEIVLGAYGNSMSLIRNATQGNPWVALDTPGIVNCTEIRTFWVGWESGLIRVGRGGEVGMDQIMHWQDPNPYAVHGLGISSGWGAVASWQFSDVHESTYIAHTSQSTDYAGVRLFVAEKTYFEFRVQACSSATVALYGEYHGWVAYEIGIGLEGNSILSIRNAKMGVEVRRIAYPDLLSCWVERSFWVSWKNGAIRIGQGLYPKAQLLEWVDEAPQPINSMTLFNWPDTYYTNGIWEFSTNQVYQVNVISRNMGYFNTLTLASSGRPFLVFSVMACADVTLVMSEILGLTNVRSYKVLIGFGPGQDQLEIHKDNARKIHRHISCVLHCTQYREFWISWENGFVRIGYGSEVGTNVHLEWQDSHPLPISAVSVNSTSQTAEFQLRTQEGESYFVSTPHGLTEVHTWLIMQRHYQVFMFDAMSCHEISVILAGELGVIHHKAYEIMFGAEEDSLIEIRKPVSGSFQRVYSVYALGYLDCTNYQSFWVSWRDGVISAGHGVPYQLPLITWRDEAEAFIQVQGLTLGYLAPDPISWKIRKDQSLQLLVSSLRDNFHLRNWITIRYSRHVSFAVRSCGNAIVYLSRHMHSTAGDGSYAIELGLRADNYSYIRDLKDGAALVSAHTPGILSCSLYRPFWIGWRGNGIEVGHGGDIGYGVFMHWNSGMAHTIRAVGVSTFGGESGNFRLPETQGNYHLVLTRSDDGNFTRVSFKMANREYIYLRIRACYGARIRLDGPGYVVEIGMNDNERIAIRLANETIVKSVESPGILSCRHLRFYWVSWFSGVVEMGRDAPLENVLISWTDSAPVPVTGFALGTEIGTEGEWQIEQHPELELTVKTPDQWDRYYLWTSVVGRDYTTFQVAACHDAHLTLSFIPLYPEMHSYQVIIGGWDNSKSAIRDEIQDGTTTKVEVSTPAILDCLEKRDFWVGWTNMTIQVGTGAVPFQYGFMQWRDDYFYEVDAVGFSTGHGSTGEWTLKTGDQLMTPTGGPVTTGTSPIPTQPPEDLSEDNMYTIYTNSTNAFDHFVLTTDQKAFLFTVNACRDVYLFLTHLPGVTDFEAYRITLGVDENTRSSIYKTLPNETTFDASTNIFTCSPKSLWVTWADGTISVGEGSDVNQGQLFTWTDTQPYAVNALAMASRDVNTVTWTLRRESGRVLNASTELHYSYNQIWFSTFSMDSAVVNIRACHDAHILLSEANGMSPNTYEVAFGINGNTQSVMREGPYGANIVWVDTPGILSCDELRYFWFRWKDQRLEVGTGSTVGKNFLMEHAKANHPETIKSIAVSTGWEATGRWEISNVQGQAYTLYTYPSTTQYENWFYTVGKSFTFQLQECQTARVILAESPLHPSTPGLVVTLGVVSSISRLPDTAPLTSVDTPQLLHCYSLRTFWITWTDGIKVGTGRINYNQFMEHRENSTIFVAAVVLQSLSPSTGAQWQIFRSTVGNSVFTTPSSGTVRYLNLWHSMAEQRYVIFKVRACADARILLAEYLAISDYHVYELWLGKNNNTYSVLTDGIEGILMDETSSHGILHCRTAMWFWIDWTKGLGIGKGPKVGDQLFLNISPGTLPRPLLITSVSYDTGPNHVGEWEFSSVPPQYFTVQTPGTYSHNHTWLIVHSVVITFKVRACEEARILLTENPYNLATYSREVIIGGWNNTRSAIVRHENHSILVERETRTILQCSELQDFWIGWNKQNGGRISVGKGVLGSGEFLTHMDPEFGHIYGVSVSTGNGFTGEWQFSTTVARVFEFKTTTTYAYDQFYLHLANQSSSTFMVQTCNDAHVGLFDYFLAEKAYEIVIGGDGNKQSFIRRTRLQENQVAVNTTNIVNCQQMLPFWVSWFSGHIKVGRGNIVDEQLFMDWLDPEPLTVTFFSITTGWSATGLWQFSNVEANSVIVNTPNNEGYSDHGLNFKTTQTFLNFVIQSCRSAHLKLSQTSFTSPLYEVIIGHNSNTKSQIIRYTMNESGINVGTVVAEEMSQGILDCSQQRPFWMSWQGGKIEVAMESSSGQRFLDWMDSAPQQVSALNLATGPESRGEWKYSAKEVTSIRHVTTEVEDGYGFFLLSLTDKSEVTFSVTACKEANVILSQIPGIFKYRSYEVLIGTAENTETWLRRSDNGALLAFMVTPGILNCETHQFFWISWTISSISFGKGNIPQQNRILYHNEHPGHALNSLSIRTPAGVRGVWGFASIYGNVYELHTPDDGSNHKYSYNAITLWQEVLIFVVKACNDAHIALQSVPGSSEDKIFEIVIGGYMNSRSEIRDGKSGPMLSFHDELGILNCLEYRQFWIRYRGGLIEVGKGKLDTHRIMSYQLTGTQNVSITALSTTTGYGSQGDWIVYESDVSSLRVTTLPEHNYNQLSKSITGQNSIVFRVQACRDAHVALSEFFNNIHTRTYEIVIGGNGNTNSFIRDYATGIEHLKVDTPNIMDCNNYRAFWVKWESSGRITVGTGAAIGYSTFLDWVDNERRFFKGLTISTWNNATGFWDFSFLQGDTYSIFTPPNYSYNYTWLWPMYSYVTFKVMSCKDAHILLSTAVQDASITAYEIVIGGSENTISAIRRGSLGQNVVQASTPNILNCEMLLSFWVRWQNQTLEVGSGPVDSHVLMRLDDPDMPAISVISVTSWYSAWAEFQFLQTEVSLVRVNSTTPQSFWTLHKSTIDVQEVKFKVKSSSDAVLAMLSVPSNLNAPSYEITIGAQGNMMSVLKSKSPMGDLITQADTPGILDPSVFRSFWISWINGTVNFGSGDVVGQSRLLSFIDPQPTYRKHVHSIAVASGASSLGEWEFEQPIITGTTFGPGVSTVPPSVSPPSSDDTILIYTDATQTPDHVVVTTQRKYFVVNVDACKEAHVYLTHIPGIPDNTAYQISIGTSSNTKSSIRKTPPTEQTVEFDTANILPCSGLQAMWVKWDQGEIMVGLGSTVGQDIKFQWKDEQPYPINAFSFASKDDKAVNWTMLRDYGRIFDVSTIKEYSYYQVWATTYYVDHIVLHIKGCRDAHILLSETYHMGDNAYEVALGILNNTASVIREGPYGPNVVSVDTPGIMSCTEFKYFWFRWKDVRMEVGTGSVVGANKLMDHAKPNHPERILSVGMSTGWEETGRYEISNVEGASYSLHTDEISDISERRNWFYPVGQYFEFQLRTCENAQIRLAEIPKREETNGYDINLMNSISSIVKISDSSIQVSKDTPLLLDCTVLRRFWITWSQGVKVGRGRLNSDVLLDLQDATPVAIAAIAITTPAITAGGGEWQVKRDTVKSTIFYTPAVYQHKYAWHTTVEEKSLFFKVRACSDVSVILTRYFGISDYGVYEILIGGQGNTKVELRFGIGGSLIGETTRPNTDLLHCTQSRWFWIDWTKGISVGNGPYMSDSALLTVSESQMPERFPFYAAAFSTGATSDGDWEFTTVPAESFTFVTPPEYGRRNAWMLMQRNFFAFQVRACSEVRVLLANDRRDLSVNVKEVLIGGWSNTRSAIYGDITSNQTVAEVDTNNILNCDSFNEFWIQWHSGGIDVGKGSLNTQIFLQHSDTSLHPIHIVSISTGDGSSGEWQLSVQAAMIYELYTSNSYTYNNYRYRVGAKTYVTFHVRACNDAHVALFDEYMLDIAYEIVIGGSVNTISAIRRTRQQDNKVQVSTPQILNCSIILPFWVSWDFGVIKVGKGNVIDESTKFMQWQDPDPLAVSIVSVSTGWEATGIWEFMSIESGNLKLHLTPEKPFGHWIKVKSSQQFFTFSVRACDSVQISICSLPSRIPVYEITLGANNNTRSGILRYEGDVIAIAAEENTPAIVDCAESRSFYVSWANGNVVVAIGSSTGRRFLEWTDPNPQQLFLLALVSMSSSVIEWDYDYKTAQVVYHQTGGEVDYYGRVMLSVAGYSEFVFAVKACTNASVALCWLPGVYRYYCYELEIGTNNNTETVLRSSIGGPILKSAQTPQILNCDSMPLFWVTWKNGYISFGKGPVPDQGAVFTVNDPEWHSIYSVSFLTPIGVTGIWMTSAATDNVYELQTPDDGQDYKYVYNLITTSSHTLIFWVKACNDAHILLQSIPGSMADQAFEIVIGGWGNTRSVLRDKKGGIELAVSAYPMELRCDSYRQFWVTWRDNTVEVGKDFPYSQSCLFYRMTNPEKTPVNALTFTTGFGSRGDWIVYETDVTSVRVTTLPAMNYNQMSKSIMGQNSVVFRVQSCKDAHLALSEVFNNVQIRTYEIIIGGNGNTNSFIRDYETRTEVQKVETPNIMDCNNSKAFWAKWETSGRITVGQGAAIGYSTFLDWVDPEKRIFQGITISTWDNAPGYWDFSYLQGDVYTVFTDADYRYNYTWLWPMYNYLTFKVKSCKDAHILLSTAVQDVSITAYEIVIGGSENTISAIRRGSLGLNVVQESTPNILNCEMLLPFWIRWQNKILEVGSGPVDSHVLMRLDDPDMPAISVASVTSWYSDWADYEFLQTEVSSIKVNSTSSRSYWTFQHSTINAQQIKFKVKSSNDAMLSLLSVSGNLKAPSYEITLGANGNMISTLKARSSNGEFSAQVDTPSILSASEYRPFWISWANGAVQFGKGDVVGQSRLLNFLDPLPTYRKDVHSVAVASGGGVTAEWEFVQQFNGGSNVTTTPQPSATPPASVAPPIDSDDVYAVFTDSTKATDFVVVTTQRRSLAFNLNACKEAHIYLTYVPGVADSSAYKVSIGTLNNTKSSIHKLPPNELSQEFDTPNILSCTNSWMWISWDNGVIMVGPGLIVGQDVKFQWTDAQPFPTNAFSLGSNDDKPVLWIFLRDYGRIFNVSTSLEYSYEQAWMTTYFVDHIILSIMGCRDAHILLSENSGSGNNSYEAALGILENTKSVIREGPYGDNIVSVETPGIMACNEYKYFWFHWKDQMLQVGTGSILGKNKIMEHAKPNHPERILSAGLSSGWDAVGRWQISNIEGVSFSMFTDEIANVSDRRVWYYPVSSSFEFQLRTCENAQIRLAEIPKQETTNGYDISLSNTLSSIKKTSDTSIQVTKDTPKLLDCIVLRKFWITWSQGVKVGTGKLNSEVLLELQDSASIQIAAISVTTPVPSYLGGEWQVTRDMVKSALFYTPASFQYKYAWYTIMEEKAVLFKVRACSEVYVLLAKFFGVTAFGVYEILIGGQGNSKLEIRHGVGGTLLAEKQMTNLLHCSQSRWFWVDWSKGIYVGSGQYISDSALLSVSTSLMPEQFPIYATAFSTGASSNGDWEFTTVPAEQFTFATPAQYGHTHAWMVMGRKSLLFKVRACSEVRILLAYDPYDVTSNVKEVVIGGWSNTKSVIYGDLTSNTTVATVDTINILNCDVFNDFWVEWYSAGIVVGKGTSLSSLEFMRYDDQNIHKINALSFSTGAGSAGEWQVGSQAALVYQLHTTTDYTYTKYWYRVGKKSFVAFKVQACNDAHIGLFDEYMADMAYEIVLGGSTNTISAIRRTRLQDNKVQISTPDILNCNQLLPFWVSWSFGLIKVGKGDLVDEKLFMQWQDPDPLAVNIVSISTGWGATGVWEFSGMKGGSLQVHTNPEHQTGHWVELKSSIQSFEFSARSCGTARILLARVPYDDPLYEIALGADNNTHSQIMRRNGQEKVLVAQEDTPGIVHCSESRSFYVSWANGKIEVATGSATGRRFMEWLDDDPQSVFAVSMACDSWYQVFWEYSYLSVLGFAHQTGGESGDSYSRILMSVVGANEFVFGVAACRDAYIAMSQVPGIYTHFTYELVIGAQDNTETMLYSAVGGNLLKSAMTPQILSCDTVRLFWLSWRNGQISFGKGIVPEVGALFTVNDAQWHAVNSLSFMTPPGVTGYFAVPTMIGNWWELHTPDDGQDYKYVYNIITTINDTLIFEVQACNDAHILLQSVPGSMEDQCFEIVIGGWSNTRSVIRDKIQGNELATYTDSSLLKCDQYRQFWVSWRNGTVQVGRNYPYLQSFLSYQMPNPDSTPVNALTFTSGFGSEADWLVAESDVTSVRATTLPQRNYNQLSKSVMSQTSVVFRVQACKDAHLALSELMNNVNTRTYEIVIGGNGNTQSFIRDYATMLEGQRVDTPNIMDCNNYKAFWVKWEKNGSGRIMAGQGAVVGQAVFIDWVDNEKRNFQGFTISTYDNAPGLWDFSFLQGNVYSLFTDAVYKYDYSWFRPMSNYLTFSVRTCDNAHLMLSAEMLDTTNAYEIVLGAFSNTKSDIRRGSHGPPLVQVDTPNIMKCDEYLPFWVRWENKTLQLGYGAIDETVLMRLDDAEMPAITAASVSSWESANGEYQFPETQVNLLNVFSRVEQGYRTAHRSLLAQTQLVFKVRVQSDAKLALLIVPGNYKTASYEFEIGVNGNTKSILRIKSATGDLVTEVDTPSILSESELRPFWISWHNATIRFGTGESVGQGQLLSQTDPQPAYRRHVHSVAVASGAVVNGEWEFKGTLDDGNGGTTATVVSSPTTPVASTTVHATTPTIITEVQSTPPPPSSSTAHTTHPTTHHSSTKPTTTTRYTDPSSSTATGHQITTVLSSSDVSSGGLDPGAVAGIVIGCLAGLLIIALIVMYVVKRQRTKSQEESQQIHFDNPAYYGNVVEMKPTGSTNA